MERVRGPPAEVRSFFIGSLVNNGDGGIAAWVGPTDGAPLGTGTILSSGGQYRACSQDPPFGVTDKVGRRRAPVALLRFVVFLSRQFSCFRYVSPNYCSA